MIEPTINQKHIDIIKKLLTGKLEYEDVFVATYDLFIVMDYLEELEVANKEKEDTLTRFRVAIKKICA